MKKKLTPEEQEFISNMADKLPPIIARKAVEWFLGGCVTMETLRNHDCAGTGPEIRYGIGRGISYETHSLLEWVVTTYGFSRLVGASNLLPEKMRRKREKREAAPAIASSSEGADYAQPRA